MTTLEENGWFDRGLHKFATDWTPTEQLVLNADMGGMVFGVHANITLFTVETVNTQATSMAANLAIWAMVKGEGTI